MPPLLDVRGLRVYYMLGDEAVKAVDGVSLKVEKGEVLGLVGESGSGKSTLGLAIVRLVPHPGRILEGSVLFKGRDLLKLPEQELSKVRGGEIGMVFQDPLTSLDPLMRVGEQLVETIMAHSQLTKEEAKEKAVKYLELVGISAERFYDYPHQFSGGMRQRAMIAMAISTSPSLLIADEPTTALDVIVQSQIMELFQSLREKLGLSVILITHDISVAMEVADKIAVMYAGHLVECAPSETLYDSPLHPYTQGLLKAVPNIELKDMKLVYIPGTPPDLANPPPGCRFHPRCPRAMDVCRREEPPEVEVGETTVKCHLYR
ncbi:MAG: ABC transporter ATP-binding protein [Thermoproteota archaeon]|nr:MAG: ABC transporter ATP-binding protein [Candidatus Korarchaeota archaeon]